MNWLKSFKSGSLATRTRAALWCVLAIGVAAPAAAQGVDLAALHEQAVREGEVVIYSATPEATMNALVAGFEADYPGVQVNQLRMTATTLFSRFLGEAEAGVTVADVLLSGTATLYYQQPELFREIDYIEEGVEDRAGRENKAYHAVYITPHIITYNSDLVSETDVRDHLKSWEDLADPRWKGQIVVSDPLATTSNMSFYKALRDRYGDEWYGRLMANEPEFVDGAAVSVQQVAAGAFSLATPSTQSHSAAIRAQGAPVVVYLPEGPAHGLQSSVAIPLNPPHPAAAELFGRWLMAREGGQAVLCRLNSVPVVEGVEGGCDPLSSEHVPAIDVFTPEDERAILSLLGRS